MRLSGSDAAVSAAVLLGVCALFYFFAQDLNSTSARTGEKTLGTVVFKKLSATRKAPSGLGWERMRNDGPVYQADTLRTAGFSEAAVYFDDGTSLDLLENSMLKLDFGGATRNLEFLSGEISVGSERSSSTYSISSSAGRIDVGKDSKATFSRGADSLSVEVSRGSASLVRSDGSSQPIAKNQEFAVDLRSGVASLVRRPIVPLVPERNARLLALGEGPAELEFSWQAEEGASASYTLEVASAKSFASPSLSIKSPTTRARAEFTAASGPAHGTTLGEGSWYWRVRDDSGRVSPTRKFSLTRSLPPRPAFPPEGQEYSYRRVKPDIRFAWTSMDAASAYLFELDADPTFPKPAVKSRTTTANLSVEGLGDGTWYWRVTPVQAFELLGAAARPLVRSFIVRKSPKMAAPAAVTPFEGSLYQVQDIDGKGLAFAWMPEPEAVSYELIVSASSDFSAPLASIAAKQPYLRLAGTACAAIKKPGEYYWGLRWIDREGNISPASRARILRGVDGSIAIRPSFPPEGYRIADSLAANARFAWKSNVPARTVFQVAKDAPFKDIAYQETVNAETLIGRAWPSGTYYWRLRTYNTDGSVFLDTKPRSFEVVDPFEGPPLLKPSPGSTFYLREHDGQELSWKGIERADYYSIKLYSAADAYSAPIMEKGFLAGTQVDFALGDLPSGSYKLSVQGFALAAEGTTRIIGYIGDSYFTYKRISYIRLGKPADKTAIPGLTMRRTGASFGYKAENLPDRAELIVSADARGNEVVARSPDRSGSATVRRLPPGNYFWTFKGELAGFDISAKESYSFSVMPIPPLPPAEILSPPMGFGFGPAELRSQRSIVLSWKPVEGATHYSLLLYASGKAEPLVERDRLQGTSFAITDLSLLDRGDFSWRVEAFSFDGEGKLEQSGLDSRASFSIQLPAVKQAQSSPDDKFYGR